MGELVKDEVIFTGLRVFCVAPLKYLCVAQKLGEGDDQGLGYFHRFALCCTIVSGSEIPLCCSEAWWGSWARTR